MILNLLGVEFKLHVCKVFIGRRIIICQYLGKILVFLCYVIFFHVAQKLPYDDESSESSGLAKIERIIFSQSFFWAFRLEHLTQYLIS